MSQEDDDSGLPEEAAGKLEQTNAVDVQAIGPWRNSDDMWTFQHYTDLEEYGEEVALAEDPVVVLVIDNEDADLAMYPNNKHYWVIYPLTYDSGTTTINIRHLTEYLSIMVEDGVATIDEVNGYEPDSNFIKLGTYQGYPVLARDPAIDDSRPETQTRQTTGQTTGNTVTTTTTIKPGASGAVTESTVDPDATDPRGRDQRNTSSTVNPDATDPRGRDQRNTVSSLSRETGADGRIQQGKLPPCLPQNAGSGSGSTPPASGSTYDDGPLRAARAAAAAPASTSSNPDATDPRGRDQRNTPTTTTPTPVTTPAPAAQSSPTSSSARPPSVYIYEPITPGFDRYDFNSGKKVYTPNNGSSRNNGGQPTVPSDTPTMTGAQSAEAAGYGSSQYGEFGPPVTQSSPNRPGENR